ncbi:conserved Plasmodium protein, unknown function [Plasmodium gallinaceum]|uniref:Uroporphyrinogen-III synthase n=1 Tax=Plasmodium gallinaceum TaxID=5849 RepID=A0A1J1GXS8_PLAGA|nr:conserved Plasmodium protein, unknown function [Plasmodium gallinaceum]CRG97102.1 conserved Plasmodium protein, unknown function [Plasmodium gallinaceum]
MEINLLKYIFFFLIYIISSVCYKLRNFLSDSFLKLNNIKTNRNILKYNKEVNPSSKKWSLKYNENITLLKNEEKEKLYVLITSPEGARIYRFLVILFIYNLKREQNCKSFEILMDNHRYVSEILKIPIISIGESCNKILNNEFKKSDFFNIYKNISLENKKEIIDNDIFNKINNDIGKLNIVFYPSKSNSTVLKKELICKFFNNTQITNANLVWISSAISNSNFNELSLLNKKKNNKIEKNIRVTKINCYDTKKVVYKKENNINKNSIICLMSNSTALSFYENFGNDFDYVICMGISCYKLLKKLNFKNVYFPEDSKTHSFLNILVNLYNKLKNGYKKEFQVVLTREKDKNEELKRILSELNIPLKIIPCTKTKYNFENIKNVYSLIYSYIKNQI